MSNRLKYLLLPIAGGLSAFLSFIFAAPFVKSLDRPWLKPTDPESHFTFGTTWTNVQHFTFGFLLCGFFCLILETGRRTPRRILISTILGAVIGGIANSLADSGADYIGILSMKAVGDIGQLNGMFAWFILVPASLSFTLAIALGPTKQRIGRAIYSTIVAAVLTFGGRIVSSVVGAAAMVAKIDPNNLTAIHQQRMRDSIPIWMTEAVIVGIALGLTTLIADRASRKGSLRLVFGRNEYRDWSLDHQANRIGSGEVEIPIRGFKGVEPVHSCIFRQGGQFIFDSQHFPATLNGYPIGQAVLNHGDTIQIGEAMLVFYAGGPVRQNISPNFAPQPVQLFPAGATMRPQPAVIPVNPMLQATPAPDPVQIVPAVKFVLIDLGGKEHLLAPGENSVGREVGNTICLPNNTTVSRQHAMLMVNGDHLIVADSGSHNGTRVNKLPIAGPTILSPGDEVAFGSATFTIQAIS